MGVSLGENWNFALGNSRHSFIFEGQICKLSGYFFGKGDKKFYCLMTFYDIIKKDIDYVYEEFLKCVIESRKISREKAEEVAQGRVWLGIDALDNKLIDKIGGFFDAFNYAKKVSGLENERHINLVFYPVAGSDKLQLDFEKNIFDSYFQNIFEFIGF